jgi:hypothetical protein
MEVSPMVMLLGLTEDPDTDKAETILNEAKIRYEVVDVASTGIVAFLDRDLDVKQLPCVLAPDRKVEGLEAIKGFARTLR